MMRANLVCRNAGALVGLIAACLLWTGVAPGATVTWTGGGANNNWSTTGNWSPAAAPGASDVVVFNTAASTSTVDSASWSIAELWCVSSSAQTNFINLAGNTLTVTGAVRIAYATNTTDAAYNSRMVISNGTFQVGTSSAGGDLYVVRKPYGSPFRTLGDQGSLTLGPALTLAASYLRDVFVGLGDIQSENGPTSAIGTLDLTRCQIQNGTLQAARLCIGLGRTSANGYVKLNDSCNLTNLIVTSVLSLGGGIGGVGGGYNPGDESQGGGYGRMGVETNGWKLPSNMSITLGQSTSSRAILKLGLGYYTAGDGLLVSSTGGTFRAYLTELRVADAQGGYNYGGPGTLDLRSMDRVVIDSLTNKIGTGGAGGTAGNVYLPVGTNVVKWMQVGGPANSVGLLQLSAGAVVVVTNGGYVQVGGQDLTSGLIQNYVRTNSCGLDMASGATLNITNYGSVRIFFQTTSTDTPHWGLRWAGDHINTLRQSLLAAQLTIDATAIGKYASLTNDGSYSYCTYQDTVESTPGNIEWSGTVASNPVWSAAANWIGGMPPVNPTPGVLTFGNNATGTNAMDVPWTVNGMNYYRTSSATCLTDLRGGALVVTGSLKVAYAPNTIDADLYTQVTITNGTLQVGMPGTPADLYVVDKPYNRVHYDRGTLTLAPGATFVAAYLRDVHVGYGDQQSEGGAAGALGILDLTRGSISNATITASNIIVGLGRTASSGYVKLPENGGLTNLVVSGTLGIGGAGIARLATPMGGGTGRFGVEANSYKLPTNLTIRVGQSASNRGDVRIGISSSYYLPSDGQIVAATGGTFTAWLNYLDVAVNLDNGGAVATGTLDLRSMYGITMNVVTARFGQGGPATVYLPAGDVTGSVVQVGASGSASLVDLRGTRFTCTSQFTNGPSGTVRVHVYGASSGIDVTNAAANSFGLGAGSVYNLVFEQTPGSSADCWGLRVAGDRQALFAACTNDGRITWNISAVAPTTQARFGIYFKDASTWIGFPQPARGTLLLIR